MNDQPTPGAADGAALARLREVRRGLLRLHKILLDDERARYERRYGQVTGGELLQLVIADEQFAWLRAISELIVRLDETFELEEPASAEQVAALFAQSAALLTPSETGVGFAGKYFSALQREPSAILAHRELMGLLKP